MTKRLIIFTFCALISAGFAFAQDADEEDGYSVPREPFVEVRYGGEVKTGLYWYKEETTGEKLKEEAKFMNNDNAGSNAGIVRFDIDITKSNLGKQVVLDNMGLKLRFEQDTWSNAGVIKMAYIYGLADLLDGNLKLRIGKLDGNQWSAGGDIWQTLDGGLIGFRVEHESEYLKKFTDKHRYNIGFAINDYNQNLYLRGDEEGFNAFGDLLKETVIGFTYSFIGYLRVNFSWRFDGQADVYNSQQSALSEGMDMMYRLEINALNKLFDNDLSTPKGFRMNIAACGWFKGIGTDDQDILKYENWFYVESWHKYFDANIRFGYVYGLNYSEFRARLGLYARPFSGLGVSWISLGASVQLQVDTGDSAVEGQWYRKFSIEPSARFDLGPGTYIAFVYSIDQEPKRILDPGQIEQFGTVGLKRSQWFNMRVVFTF